MTPGDMGSLVDRYIDAYNRKDVDAMLRTLHEFTNIAGGTVTASARGIAEPGALAQQSAAVFSERCQVMLQAGQVLTLSGRTEFEFRDGAICRITDVSQELPLVGHRGRT
ncbi:MAG TPA: hypothetical protein VFI92_08570 [Steroidobacteraceae bacterium]|nr:hypothetical protein [Steroidobacteraceae bacterium]